MQIIELLEQLTFGELKSHDLGGYSRERKGTKEVKPEDYKEIVSHLNRGLLKLYTRFPILTKRLGISIREGVSLYQLKQHRAFSSGSADWYLRDSYEAPFLEDILRIEGVFDICGDELPINDPHGANPVYLPTPDMVQIPQPTSSELYIVYKAKPRKVPVPDITSDEQIEAFKNYDVYLPEVLQDALTYYVEYRVHKSRTSQEGVVQGQAALNNYEAACLDVEYKNLLHTSSIVTNLVSHDRGFV